MDAFTRYISTSPIANRTFISNPPGPAILIWSNNLIFPDLSGVSLVESINESPLLGGVTGQKLATILHNLLGNQIPFLHILYDPNLTYMIINQQRYTINQSANVISQNFGVQIGNSQTKIPNNPAMITDPFHVWSRAVFSGSTVKKVDIDLAVVNPNQNNISSIIEIKRSNRPRVGRWAPYQADINNYLMMMGLSNYLSVNFHTVHHDDLNTINPINLNNNVDIFTFRPNYLLPNQQIFNQFRLEINRGLISVTNAINVF